MIWLNAYEHKPAKYLLVLCCLDEIGEDLVLGYYDGVHWKSADGKLFIAPLCYSILPLKNLNYRYKGYYWPLYFFCIKGLTNGLLIWYNRLISWRLIFKYLNWKMILGWRTVCATHPNWQFCTIKPKKSPPSLWILHIDKKMHKKSV